MGPQEISERIQEERIFVILRKIPSEKLIPLTEALFEGGIRAIEVTFNTPGAPHQLELLIRHFSSRLLIGAGTIMNKEEAKDALQIGAQFLVSPHVSLPMIREARKKEKIAIAGAMTPTEIQLAHEAGADLIKLFPAGTLGEEYFRQIRGPFDKISFVAVGGITQKNITPFSQAGAVAFGIGSAIVEYGLVEKNNFDEIKERARQMVLLANSSR